MHSLFQHISSSKPDTDIILIQEPWWGKVSSSGARGEARAPGWRVLLPVNHIDENSRPRVLAYTRDHNDIEVIPRTDIAKSLDLQVIDIKRRGSRQRVVRLINIYNAPTGSDSFAVDLLPTLALNPTTPTIITGDWNMKHPRICTTDKLNPDQRATNTMEWIDTNGFSMVNETDQITWQNDSGTQQSSLDLTFVNE
ncbi:hypothetical protein DL93DRAFT_2173764, partial [Clavulina sp. PMI_390]